ncbi:MAG: ASCH domain-containing protein [Tenericutes bacterium]|nr:ASCH domain-containing protein [Mycoplasmatota bacterium]
MCKILMPINPEYVDEILAGRKKYEYRKIKAKRTNIDKMIIYSTSPVMKVVAEVEIKGILQENPEQLWELTKNYSGVTKEFYNQYYKNKNIAIAYELGKIVKYEKPKDLIDIGINYIPQSFVYMDN